LLYFFARIDETMIMFSSV